MDEEPPPDYHVNWNDGGSSGSFFGCVGMAFGLVFMATGGLCAWLGLGSGALLPALIGLMFLGFGWMLIKR